MYYLCAMLIVEELVRSSDDPGISDVDPADLFVQGEREIELQKENGARRWGTVVTVTDGAGWCPAVLVVPDGSGGVSGKYLGD